MTAAYAMGLFGIFCALSAVLAFVWAAARGQMRSTESAKYFVLDADETENEVSPPAPLPRHARWLAAALVIVFLGILSSTILTVIIAARAGTPQAAPQSAAPSPPAKCPVF